MKTFRDFWWKRKNQLLPQAGSATKEALLPEFDPNNAANKVADAGLVTDSTLGLGKAEEAYAQYQVSDGFDVLKSGLGPQTAAEEQNLLAALDQLQQMPPTDPVIQPVTSNDLSPVGYVDPCSPFSTIPGGPGFGPPKMPGG